MVEFVAHGDDFLILDEENNLLELIQGGAEYMNYYRDTDFAVSMEKTVEILLNAILYRSVSPT